MMNVYMYYPRSRIITESGDLTVAIFQILSSFQIQAMHIRLRSTRVSNNFYR